MTIRIVTPPMPKTREVTCTHCGAGLEYELNDVRSTPNYERGGVEGYTYSITCPCCNKDINVSQP